MVTGFGLGVVLFLAGVVLFGAGIIVGMILR